MTPDPTLQRTRDGSPAAMGARRSRWLESLLLLPPVLVLAVVGSLTPASSLFPHQGDVELYLRRGEQVANGAIPYRDFDFEYPPLGIVPMVVPYLFAPTKPPDLETYKWLFLAWEAALLVALGVAVRRIARRGALPSGPVAVAARLTLVVGAAALPLAWRYDLFPTLLTALAVLAALGARPAWTGALLGLGVLAKLFPLVVAPAVAVRWLAARDGDAGVRLVTAATIVVAAAFAPFAVAAGPAALGFLGYQAGRGLQVESIGGGLALLAGAADRRPVVLDFSFSAVHVTGSFADAWLASLPVLTVAGFGAVALVTWRWVRAARAAGVEVPAAVVVALVSVWILALLATSKVLSVQYVVWLVPFAALLPRGQLLLAAAICALSMGVHPWQYERLIAQDLGPILLLNVRNALVVALFAWLLLGLARQPGLARGRRLRSAAVA